MGALKALICDDSTLVRRILRAELSRLPGVVVVAEASDPYEARERLETQPIDLVILDLEMPRMDGLTFLKHLMRDHPLPVIVSTSLGREDALVRACLDAGAVAVVSKPQGAGRGPWLAHLGDQVAACRPKAGSPVRHLVAFGASTGGPAALESVFSGLPRNCPPVVAAVHMPARFTRSFAQRLDSRLPQWVKEAEDGEVLLPDTIYIAPGDRHLLVRPRGASVIAKLSAGPRVWNQRPSVDILFESVASLKGFQTTAVLLTGMGHDGAQGLRRIRESGGHTAVQDEATSVVFGMPKEAIALGAAQAVLGIDDISGWVEARIV